MDFATMTDDRAKFLTVRELAELLHVKERKIYALVAAGEVPCSRATGKLLFPRHSVEAWIARHSTGDAIPYEVAARPVVCVGSHDPLLEWTLRESRSGIATFFDGSLDGLRRLKEDQAIVAGLHLHEAEEDGEDWNSRHVAESLAGLAVVLLEWAWRERGLIVAPDNPMKFSGLSDLPGKRVVPRQAEAGSQLLFETVLATAGVAPDSFETVAPPARSETDVAVAVAAGKADVGFGLAGVARQFRLGFVPIMRERYDLVVFQRAYFLEPFQSLLAFCRSEAFTAKARDFGGYDLSGFGRVRYVGP